MKVKISLSPLTLFTIFALWLGLILGCNSAETPNSSQQTPVSSSSPKATSTLAPVPQIDGKITKQELGTAWAFTVDEGVLACDGKNGVGAVTFTSGGKTYAVNGAAKQTKKYEPIDSIWADDPSIKGAKKNIGSIIERGLKLCK